MYTRQQQTEYQRTWTKQRREKFLKLLGNKCVQCGSTENLEFDHIDPKTKLFEIADCGSKSYSSILLELKKCQLLCKLHHKEKTLPKHGTYSRYKGRKCRCELCKIACRDYMRTYRSRRIGKVLCL